MSRPLSPSEPKALKSGSDPVIEAYKRHLDRSLLRENLRKTPEERVRALMELQRLADEARRAGEGAARRP